MLLYVLYAGGLALAFRWLEGPPILFDDAYFLLVSYSWLNGLGFDNVWVNPISSAIFNWHGFLQPMLVGWLSPCGTLDCLNIAVIAIGGVFLAAWYPLVNTVTSSRVLRWMLYVIAVACILQYSARPELLAAMGLVAITALFYFLPNERAALRGLAAGVLVGLVTVTSPVAGVLTGIGVSAATIYVRRSDTGYTGFALEGLVCLVSALVTIAVMLTAVYPYAAQDWLEGIRMHSAKTAAREDTSGFLKAYVAARLIPFQAVMFMVLAGIAGYALMQIWRAGSRIFSALFILICFAAAYLLYYTAIRIPLTAYNLTVLVPAIALIAVMIVSATGAHTRYAKIALIAPLALFAAACCLGQAVWAMQTVTFIRDQHRLAQGITQSVDRYMAANRRIAMDPPLMAGVDDVRKLKDITILFFGQPHKENDNPPNVDVLYRSQREFGAPPAEIPGFKLVENNYDQSVFARLLRPKGTYYAIYEAVAR
ncbi:hypothetical protein [Pseudorhodoplanes sinuspersici]|uniref:Uncharacterized protein n=1 Tax=Pseudorhodoplanes sinuspersici TaxID=1235591 RepID=A0A1W6ZV27_9HYPH|nr:hypothetical protein [Pseudorhodoplanes sinuspersici]ARQ01257.1 hypothetical protein CAK95_20780 [Pseudorhodoplanes sinuspersici]